MATQMHEMKIRLTMLRETLGTASANKEIHEEYIASKAPDAQRMEDEIAAIGVDAAVEKAMTIFPKLPDGTPFIWDYQIRGFFKSACGALRKVKGSLSSGVKAYKKEIDELVFIEEEQIPFHFDGKIESCQRPLRAQTAQGERVALANSESIPRGATLEFTVACYQSDDLKLVREWLDHGRWNGLGQWRNSGKGRFTWEEIDADGNPIPRKK